MTDNATEQAALALAFLRMLKDFNDKVDDTRKYLEMVQAEASVEQYNGFVACLKEFAEETLFQITQQIDDHRDYVTKCALIYLEGYHDLIWGLSDYIPEILEPFLHKKPREQPDSKEQESRQECATQSDTAKRQTVEIEWQQPSTQSDTAKRQRLLQTVPLEWHQEKLSLQDREKKIQKQKMQEQGLQKEMRFFMDMVQERFLHSDAATYTKIETLMQQFFVEGNMSEKEALKTMSPLLQRHKDLWKEFQGYFTEDCGEAFSTDEDDPQPGLLSADMREELSTEEDDDLQLALQMSIAEAPGKHDDNPS